VEEHVDSGFILGHPGGNPWANLKSIFQKCYIFEVAFVWELTNETIKLPLGCLQGGIPLFVSFPIERDGLINVAQPLYHRVLRDEALHGLRQRPPDSGFGVWGVGFGI